MNQIRAIRKGKKLTLHDVASAAGISVPFLADVEKGFRGAKPETWAKIADALSVTVEELRGGANVATADNRANG